MTSAWIRKTALVASVALVAAVIAARMAGAADTTGSIVVGGVTRTYVVNVPAKLGSKVPLILSFHGHFGTGASQARLTGLSALSETYGFIVVYPDGINRGWNDGRALTAGADDIGFLRALIADFSRRYPIDPARVYVTGFSNGATFAQYAGCQLANQIAAIAPVAGSMPTEDAPGCHPARPISVLEIAGTADPMMPIDGGPITLFGITRSTVLSAQQTVAMWAGNDKCAPSTTSNMLAHIAPDDGTGVTQMTYPRCAAGTNVVFYRVAGGGHAWPGGPQYSSKALIGTASQQLDASQTIVDFFLAHPMR
jgi:polyhydroxybutyrate depolymerase